ncbi:MAG: ABC transporter permease, partial [Thermoplasmata archaeon]|nr:ABC transporter permease [Thermoplasmata archaeon]
LRELGALTRREFLKLARNPQAIFTSLLFPLLYLLLFGQGFNINPAAQLPPGTPPSVLANLLLYYFRGAPNYYSYFVAGMVGFVAVTATLFIGANVIFDKLFGVFKRTRGTPAPSAAVFGSRLIAGAAQPIALSFFVLGLALLLGHLSGLSGLDVTASVGVIGGGEVVLAIVLLSLMFATLFLTFGILLEVPQTYFAAVNLLNLPVLLTSDALYPWGTMPAWLQNVSQYNPVSLAVNVLRETLFGGAAYPYAAGIYLLGLLGWTVVLVGIAIALVRRALRPLA